MLTIKSKFSSIYHFLKWRNIILSDKDKLWKDKQQAMRRIRRKAKIWSYFNTWKNMKKDDESVDPIKRITKTTVIKVKIIKKNINTGLDEK